MTELADLMVASLGEPRFDSPLSDYIADRRDQRALRRRGRPGDLPRHGLPAERDGLHARLSWPASSRAGPRRRLFFPPGATRVGIVTCGGLCPGLNDVIRGLVMELVQALRRHRDHRLPARLRRDGAGAATEPIALTPEVVHDINEQGGTILGTSRGAQDPDLIVDELIARGIDILFVIGGDGSMRGAARIAAGAARAAARRSP